MRNSLFKTLVALAVLTAIVLGNFPRTTITLASGASNQDIIGDFDRLPSYGDYLYKYKEMKFPNREIIISAVDYAREEGAELEKLALFQGERDVLEWKNQDGWVEWNVDVPESGLYTISMKYFPLPGKGRDLEFELSINGQLPFEGARKLLMNRIWKDETDILKDNRDNELRPRQIEAPQWIESDFKDTEGLYNGSYSFYLDKGQNKVRLTSIREPFALKQIRIYQKDEISGYDEVVKSYTNKGYSPAEAYIQHFQAEKAFLKSHSVLHPIYDKSSPKTEPYDPTKLRMNTIGSDNWKFPGQWISWKIDVPEDGLYKIGLRFRQNTVRGFFTTRKIMIDQKVPFKEMEEVRFPYGIDWQIKTLGEDGEDNEPYLFYLTKGVHEFSMEVSMGEIAQTLRTVEDSVFQLNDMYRKIIMITGVQPDLYRDYFLEKSIPDLLDTFNEVSSTLRSEAQRLENITGQKGTEAVLLLRISEQLDSLVEKPETIPERLEKYKSNVSSLASWILKIKEQPLELDYIVVAAPDEKMPKARANMLEKLVHEVRSFAGSFFEDYNNIGNVYENKKSIDVWVGLGRDQAYVIKSLIDDLFTPETGISVNVSLVQGALLQATMAGKGPDVALNVGRGEPVNLALRGAVVDLNRYGDFNEVTERFMPTAMVPYKYKENYYALPETQLFHMMFYRKDIFREIGINVPQTWGDMYDIAPEIQVHNMNIGLPYVLMDAYSLLSTGMGAQSIFPTLLSQNGIDFYNNNNSKTNFDTPEAFKAFKVWADFYNLYGFPLFKDDYSRFRTGEMPLVIAPYTFYNMLAVAAPEIRNLWDMVPIPGLQNSDGSINRTECASGTASIIISKSKNIDASWEFLKWWTSADIQTRFGNEIEAMMGAAGRYTPANVKAFEQIPWSDKEQKILMEQWRQTIEIPEVPGGYYTSRNIDNAFRSVVFNYDNPREALFYWNKEIDKEIERKRLEFGLD